MELIFIRHGETTDNIEQCVCDFNVDMRVEITQKGREQALQAAELLKDDKIDAIFVSDMLRTQQTAKAIFGEDEEFIFDSNLREHVASLTPGVKYVYGKIPQDERIKLRLEGFSDGEKYIDQVNRIKSFLDKLSHMNYNKVAIVTHGGCLRTLYVIAGLLTIEQSLLMGRKDNCGIVRAVLSKDGKLKISE